MEQPSHIGRYAIRREIGRGSMGVVYEALDPVLERTVAIKTIRIGLGSEETVRYEERFLLEARAAGGLNHPNIITIYDVGRSAEGAYICMELLEGRELKEIMASNGLTLRRALEIAAQVADGLAYAHERGVVHRDIKPANIMVLAGDRVKIADFGIARKRTSEAGTQSEVVLGSPSYLSPEQALGKPCDGRSDIFSLGVIIYQLVAGRLPFRGADLSELLYQIVHAEPLAPSAASPAVPAMLDRIVAQALAKKTDARYAGAAQFAAELRACREQVHGAAATALQVQAGEERAAITAELAATEQLTRTDEIDLILSTDTSPVHTLAQAFESSEAVLRFATFDRSAHASNAEAGGPPATAVVVDAKGETKAERVASRVRAQPWSQRARRTFLGAVGVALAFGVVIVLG